MQQKTIAPGVRVSAIGADRFKRFKINIHFITPGKRETATASAVLPHILERRCEAVPEATALSRRLYDLYGAELTGESYTAGAARVVTLGISGLQDRFALEGEALAEESMKLLLELVFRPKVDAEGVFEAEDVAIELAKQADHLRNEMNDKRGYCLRQARRKLYGGLPIGIESAGYFEDIDGLTPADIYAAYTEMLRTATIEVVVCGAGLDVVADAVAERLAGVERAPAEAVPAYAAPMANGLEEYAEPMDTVQGKLAILCTSGNVCDARGDAVMRMASAVLGGLPTSRLFMNVREKQSLCYYCVSVYGAFSGTLQMDSGVDHANADKAFEAMLEQLRTLQQELITEEELVNAKKALLNSFTAAKDSPDAMAGWVFTELLRGTGQTLDSAAELVQGVTREEIREALASFVPAVRYTLTGKEGA